MGQREILAALDRHLRMFDLSGDLGERALEIAVGGVAANFDVQCDPRGVRWPALSEGYATWKAVHYPGLPMGVREGLLRSDAEFRGVREAAADHARWTYGVTAEARLEAYCFQAETATKPARPFVGITDEAAAASRQLFDSHFKENL